MTQTLHVTTDEETYSNFLKLWPSRPHKIAPQWWRWYSEALAAVVGSR